MKQKFYIFSFTVLGFLMGLVIYGLGSLVLIKKGYSFDSSWYLGIMLVAGIIAGFFEGRRWWRIIYVEKAYLKWTKHKLQYKLIGLTVLIILTIAVTIFFGNYLK